MSVPWASPKRAALVIVRSAAIGLGLGLLLYAVGIIKQLWISVAIHLVFTTVMWPAFELLAPWYHPPDRGERSPAHVALLTQARILGLFTVLVALCLVLIYLLTGVNFVRYPMMIVFSYLFGLAITTFMNSLHTTSSMVESERARARAEVDKLRFEMLEADVARKTKELEEARALQTSMLPLAPPAHPHFSLAFGMRTATEVGGDYYDVRETADALELVLGDATGHGTKAGLLVVAAKTLFQTEIAKSLPSAALHRANAGVKSLNMVRMNMALTRVSARPGRLSISAAGMPPALHYRAEDGKVAEIAHESPPTGQMRRAVYTDTEVPFAPGDRLVLFSDGFPECQDPNGDPLGYEAACDAFERVATRPPAEIVEALFLRAEEWAAGRPFDDDVSFLVLAAR